MFAFFLNCVISESNELIVNLVLSNKLHINFNDLLIQLTSISVFLSWQLIYDSGLGWEISHKNTNLLKIIVCKIPPSSVKRQFKRAWSKDVKGKIDN